MWQEITERFGVNNRALGPLPHLSYHVGQGYDSEMLFPILTRFVETRQSFSVKTDGIGVFTRSNPLTYVAVIRSIELSRFQQELWDAVNPVSKDPFHFNVPQNWVPHITLYQGEINDKLPQVLGFLALQDFNWEISIDHISLTYDPAHVNDSRLRFDLKPAT